MNSLEKLSYWWLLVGIFASNVFELDPLEFWQIVGVSIIAWIFGGFGGDKS